MRTSGRGAIAVSALVAGVVLGVLTSWPARAGHDQQVRPPPARSWPSPIVLLTVDGVIPPQPSVVIVTSPELDRQYRTDAETDQDDVVPVGMYAAGIALASAAAFGAIRIEARREPGGLTARRRA